MLRRARCGTGRERADLSQDPKPIAVVPRLHDLAAHDPVNVNGPHSNWLPLWFDTRVRLLQRAREHVPRHNQITLGENILHVVIPIRERRPVRKQALHVQVTILLGDQCAMVHVIVREHGSERIGVTGIEGGKIRFCRRNGLFRSRGRTGRCFTQLVLGPCGTTVAQND